MSDTDSYTYPRLRVGVVIGRFNPVHRLHVDVLIRPALAESDYVFVLLGSSRSARDFKNPFDHNVRSALIYQSLTDAEMQKLKTAPIEDFPYSDTRWQMQCYRQVENLLEQVLINHPGIRKDQVQISLFGVNKDESSWYLKLFPQWTSRTKEAGEIPRPVSSTDVRNALYELILDPDDVIAAKTWSAIAMDTLLPSVRAYLEGWAQTPEALRIAEEWKYVQDYKRMWAGTPYPVIFQTVDNVVIHKGHILLVKRDDYPGKGLWALPGGYIKPDETLRTAAFRELKEETSIVFKDSNRPVRVNETWIKFNREFDYPGRSLRGRTITQAYLWEIPIGFEVDVTTRDEDGEVSDVQWFPLEAVLGPEFECRLFEDHKHIIDYMVKEL